jgi:uncharacterized protein (DUF362 family)
MDRRQFIEQVAAWSAGAAIAAPIFNVSSILAAEAAQKSEGAPLLSVAKGKDYAALVDRVMKPLGGIANFVKKDDRVVVKPNIGWDRSPEQAANTHPDVVKAIVQHSLDAGAKRVMVFDYACNDARRTYTKSGIKKAVESIGDPRAQCVFVDSSKFIPVDIEKAKSIKRFQFYKDAMPPECDCYINVPIAKNHVLAKLTIGLKNIMGVIGGNRGDIHRDIGDRIADLNLVIYPKLTIVDATRILLRNGPTGGNVADVKVLDTLIASADTVAADAYATTLFDMKPEDLSSTVAAAALGLGEMDLSKVKIVEA